MIWYLAKALQIIGLGQVLLGLLIGIPKDDLKLELQYAIIGVAVFLVGRLLETKFSKR